MELATLKEAIQEAERFIRSARKAKDSIMNGPTVYFSGSKETAAAKRASLDLTRKLADLRAGR